MPARSRTAFTLIESIVVLGVMGMLVTSFTFMVRPDKQSWSKFEREFSEAFMVARQKQVGRNEAFYIQVQKEHVNVDGQIVRVPENWFGGEKVIRCQVFTMAPTSFSLYNKETMRRRNVVFQLGGGTYHVET
ncbi:type II secretion system protein [Weissella confusa]|uniref:Type II secretion system protein n=1 Tax=Weissella confusa TaxID=1583 RepID=A0A4Z0RZY3_WEICO|nr:type II secretion system protein [Weissella confusa]TGE74114.1 hypothetical protein C6P11_03860 [Weissella confusa]